MTLVVDASVALKWMLLESDSADALALLGRDLLAPDWWLVEAANGIGKAVRRRQISLDEAQRGLNRLANAPMETVRALDLLDDALALSARLNHPVYDCLYLALAARGDGLMVTADKQFVQALADHPDLARRVVLLADFQP